MVVAVKQKPKNTVHHRKRRGGHQKRSNHFVKTYWPYLPMLLLVGIGLFLNGMWAHASGVLGYATDMTSGGLLSGTNVQRTQNGLGSLSLNSSLSQAAQAKANDMVARNYWSHTTPDGQEPWTFINKTGYAYQAAGENLAYGFSTSGDTITGWMNSPGHRANILNGNYREVGFGIANGANYQGEEETVVVAMYAQPVAPITKASPIAKAPVQRSAAPTPSPTAAATPNIPVASQQPIAAETNPETQQLHVSAVVPGETKVARVQLATSSGTPWSVYALSIFMIVVLVAFVLRHSLAWHRMWVRGEQFVLRHKFLDFIMVSGLMIGYLLTRTVGIIQ
jgi:hypothetical protein